MINLFSHVWHVTTYYPNDATGVYLRLRTMHHYVSHITVKCEITYVICP